MTIQEHINGILEIAGLQPEDVHAISIKPGQVEFSVWAKNDDGGIATIETSIGHLPLTFTVVASIGEPAHDHDHDTSMGRTRTPMTMWTPDVVLALGLLIGFALVIAALYYQSGHDIEKIRRGIYEEHQRTSRHAAGTGSDWPQGRGNDHRAGRGDDH